MVDDARFPSAMAAMPDGGFVYAERLTGDVRLVTPDGRLVSEPLVRLDVGVTGEQRGLLGLAADADGRVFASWTDVDERLVVGEVTGGSVRIVWLGPPSADRANGGRIAFAPDGSIVIGIGDLLDPAAAADPRSPNGKLLRLDPDGVAEQAPEVISSGWNNPFAFTFTPAGALWVADNAPVEEPERFARGDILGAPAHVSRLPPHGVPTGLAALGEHRFLLCTYLTRQLRIVTVDDLGLAELGAPLAADCSLGVAILADGSVLYANETQIRELLASP